MRDDIQADLLLQVLGQIVATLTERAVIVLQPKVFLGHWCDSSLARLGLLLDRAELTELFSNFDCFLVRRLTDLSRNLMQMRRTILLLLHASSILYALQRGLLAVTSSDLIALIDDDHCVRA